MRWTRSARAALLAVGVAALLLTGCTARQAAGTLPSAAATTAAAALRPLPAHPRILFLGDSWAAGWTAAPGRGFPFVTAEALHGTAIVDAVPGTGFSHNLDAGTLTYPERVPRIPASTSPDLVVVQGGLNDQFGDLTKVKAGAISTVRLLQHRFPRTPVVVFGPGPLAVPPPPALVQVDASLASAARRCGVPYVSPLKARWFTAASVGHYIDPATSHPSTTGHAYVGARLADAIARLVPRR